MSQTVLGIFGVTLAAALSELLLPGDEGKGTKGALRMLVALAVLLLLLRPFLSFLGSDPVFSPEDILGEGEEAVREQYEEILHGAVSAGSESALRRGLYALLWEEYGIAEADAHIRIVFGDRGALARVEIYLSGKALLTDPDVLAADIGARLGCETEVR